MRKFRSYALLLLVAAIVCDQPPRIFQKENLADILASSTPLPTAASSQTVPKGALLTTRFTSFEQLKTVIHLDYFIIRQGSDKKYMVRLTHPSNGQEITSVLKSGVSEKDFFRARDGGFWDRVALVWNSPYSIIMRNDLRRIYFMGKRMYKKFKVGDVAFYDLAETMFGNIEEDDLAKLPPEDLTEKGFINTFNHLTGQAFMTSIFSEELADFIADSHEISRLPELVTGEFTKEQVLDLDNGPVDNYVDLINNEYGQELGKRLKKKYNINRDTHWTPELLTNYLNDVQAYYSWAFQIGFHPYRETDEVVIRFSGKINRIMRNLSEVK